MKKNVAYNPTIHRYYEVEDLAPNRCVLRDVGTGIEVEYWCPRDGGYVREIDAAHPGTLGTQVCNGLLYRGSTLVCSARRMDRYAHVLYSEKALGDLIRGEAQWAYAGYDRASEMDARRNG